MEGYRVREIENEMESERMRNTHNSWGSINGPSIRGRFGLMLKLDEHLGPSMTFEVVLILMKYLRIYNISIHTNFYQNRFINESVRKNFLKFSKRRKDVKTERRKDGVFL